MPQAAAGRIQRLEQLEETDKSAFTSDLSVNEFVLLHKLGFDPLGYVMGTSIYHVGLQYGNWRQSMELEVLTAAMYNARELAIDRMRTEAHALKADGIVGVHLAIQQHAWGAGELEFVAQGTAVTSKDPNNSPTGAPSPLIFRAKISSHWSKRDTFPVPWSSAPASTTWRTRACDKQ